MWAGAKPKVLPPCAAPQCDEPAVGEGYCARHLLHFHGLPIKPRDALRQSTPSPRTGRLKWLVQYVCRARGRAAPQQPPTTRTCPVWRQLGPRRSIGGLTGQAMSGGHDHLSHPRAQSARRPVRANGRRHSLCGLASWHRKRVAVHTDGRVTDSVHGRRLPGDRLAESRLFQLGWAELAPSGAADGRRLRCSWKAARRGFVGQTQIGPRVAEPSSGDKGTDQSSAHCGHWFQAPTRCLTHDCC